jgi:hypothetical protein
MNLYNLFISSLGSLNTWAYASGGLLFTCRKAKGSVDWLVA